MFDGHDEAGARLVAGGDAIHVSRIRRPRDPRAALRPSRRIDRSDRHVAARDLPTSVAAAARRRGVTASTTIVGRVTSEAGAPIANAVVTTSFGASTPVLTNDAGTFRSRSPPIDFSTRAESLHVVRLGYRPTAVERATRAGARQRRRRDVGAGARTRSSRRHRHGGQSRATRAVRARREHRRAGVAGQSAGARRERVDVRADAWRLDDRGVGHERREHAHRHSRPGVDLARRTIRSCSSTASASSRDRVAGRQRRRRANAERARRSQSRRRAADRSRERSRGRHVVRRGRIGRRHSDLHEEGTSRAVDAIAEDIDRRRAHRSELHAVRQLRRVSGLARRRDESQSDLSRRGARRPSSQTTCSRETACSVLASLVGRELRHTGQRHAFGYYAVGRKVERARHDAVELAESTQWTM